MKKLAGNVKEHCLLEESCNSTVLHESDFVSTLQSTLTAGEESTEAIDREMMWTIFLSLKQSKLPVSSCTALAVVVPLRRHSSWKQELMKGKECLTPLYATVVTSKTKLKPDSLV